MQAPRVSHYRLAWSDAARIGTIVLVHTPGGETTLTNLSATEFHTVSTFLRNERPVFFDPATRTLYTANEITGEEEVD